MPIKVLVLALAGALGTLARVALGYLVQRWAGPRLAGFPVGTAAVNLLGCFAFGLVWTLGAGQRLRPELQSLVLLGFLGAFTTFSSFVNDTMLLGHAGRVGLAFANVLGQNALGLACFALGAALARWLV